jgi:hypothetical protein
VVVVGNKLVLDDTTSMSGIANGLAALRLNANFFDFDVDKEERNSSRFFSSAFNC